VPLGHGTHRWIRFGPDQLPDFAHLGGTRHRVIRRKPALQRHVNQVLEQWLRPLEHAVHRFAPALADQIVRVDTAWQAGDAGQ
jgi:hypothetical protein